MSTGDASCLRAFVVHILFRRRLTRRGRGACVGRSACVAALGGLLLDGLEDRGELAAGAEQGGRKVAAGGEDQGDQLPDRLLPRRQPADLLDAGLVGVDLAVE